MGHNYEAPYDTKGQTAHVITKLKYGDLTEIPKPWITILIPTYKRIDLLEQAIESVLTQHHCDYMWDIVVLDNEPDNGECNETEKLIRKLDSKRILYYRNSENIRPGDNFNRGLLVARGEWVCFLHDDDLLIANTLQRLGTLIRGYQNIPGKPLGAISAKYHQFTYNPKTKQCNEDIPALNHWYCTQPLQLGLYKLTHTGIWMTANIGGDVPSNGTVFNRKAALACDGFIEDFGISGDLILFYRMEKNYSVYSTLQPMGFYRWGSNTMVKPESTRRVIKDGYDFREYVYSKNWLTRILGKLLRRVHYRLFTIQVIAAKNLGVDKDKQINREDFCLDNVQEPQLWWYFIFTKIIMKIYFKYKGKQCKKLERQICKYWKD